MRFLPLLSMFSFIGFVAGCEKSSTLQTKPPVVSHSPVTESENSVARSGSAAVMHVRGMACPQCAYNVDLQLLKVPGVQSVKVDMSTGVVVAQLSPENPPTQQQLAAAIRQTGFTLVKIEMH